MSWIEDATSKGWRQEDIRFFLERHPDALDITFKNNEIHFFHVATFAIRGVDKNGVESIQETHRRLGGTWAPAKKSLDDAVAWTNKPFEGEWCPCHGAGGCPKQIMSRVEFCACKGFRDPSDPRRIALDGTKGLHARHCSLYLPIVGAIPTREWVDDNGVLHNADPQKATPKPEPIVAPPKPVKQKRKQKTVIESLNLPGMK